MAISRVLAGPVPVQLPVEGAFGVRLHFDDETREIGRVDLGRPWRGLTVSPGETLTAHVPNNTTLTIRYRRSGIGGLLERRTAHPRLRLMATT